MEERLVRHWRAMPCSSSRAWMRSAQETSGTCSLIGVIRATAPARPLLAPWLISGAKRMLPSAPPHLGHSETDASWVPESCHARRIRMGPQFFSLIRAARSSFALVSCSTFGALRGVGRHG